jgi:hypothetical protein
MSVTRRAILVGSGAVFVSTLSSRAACTKESLPDRRQTVAHQGALSAGGFVQAITMSDDGLTRLISYDGSNAWIWSERLSRWENAFSQARLPPKFRLWGQDPYKVTAFSASAVAVSPSNSKRIYVVASAFSSRPSMVWRSDDRAETWVDTGYRIGVATATPRGLGPVIAVDPKNPDVLYISDEAGVIHRTFDAGITWQKPSAINSVLLTAETKTFAKPGTSVLEFEALPSGDLNSQHGVQIYVSSASRMGSSTNSNYISKIEGTTVKLIFPITGAGVSRGDIIAFGGRAAIVFDPSSPRIEGRTQRILIGWSYGVDSVYESLDGGGTFKATRGGPAKIRRMAISADGDIYACARVLPQDGGVSVRTNAWRYRAGMWANLPVEAPGSGNVWSSCATDPFDPKRVAFACDSGGLNLSGDRGATWYSKTSRNIRVAKDVPWLGPDGTIENWQSNGMIAFDPIDRGRLWIAEGVGLWHCTPPVAPGQSPEVQIISQNKNQQGLIVDKLVKPPGQALVLAVQDRCGFRIPDVTREPESDFGIFEQNGPLSRLAHGWSIDYAKNEPSFQVCLVGTYAWYSEDGGRSWKKMNSQPAHINAGGTIAVQTRSNFVWFPANNGMPAYTKDGGKTWVSCLFNGSARSEGWAFSMYLNRHVACADYVDSQTYYAYSYSNNSNGGLWRSTDGGANWINMSGGIGRLLNTGSADFHLTAIPGKIGHLMFGGGSAFNNTIPLLRSVDAGASWRAVWGTKVCWQVAAGKAAPGADYPSIFITGIISGDPRPGVFRSDNFSENPSAQVSWIRLCEAPAGNMDGPKCLCGDLEEHGVFYLGLGSTGYVYGKLGTPN